MPDFSWWQYAIIMGLRLFSVENINCPYVITNKYDVVVCTLICKVYEDRGYAV